jgi:hypothetical protein
MLAHWGWDPATTPDQLALNLPPAVA